jgi:hypothetical protein
MSEITLHFRVDGQRACAVCGADLQRRASRWWLTNTWTRDARYYREQETNLPGESSRPCGSPPRELVTPANGPAGPANAGTPWRTE